MKIDILHLFNAYLLLHFILTLILDHQGWIVNYQCVVSASHPVHFRLSPIRLGILYLSNNNYLTMR